MVGHLDVLDDEGAPRAFAAEAVAPGLRFVGYLHIPAQLRYWGREAKRAAKAIAARAARAARPDDERPDGRLRHALAA